jgi:hypothetical protein
MATESVSSTRTAGVTVAHTNSNAQRPSATAGEERPRAKSTQAQSAARQVINIDGKSFDRHAPRGTYLNIVA